jgi:hypothetical protein
LVLGSDGAAIYVNGKLQASSDSVSLRPDDLGITTIGYIGRSQFPISMVRSTSTGSTAGP